MPHHGTQHCFLYRDSVLHTIRETLNVQQLLLKMTEYLFRKFWILN